MKTVILSGNEHLNRHLQHCIKAYSAPNEVAVISEQCNILKYFEQNPADMVFLDIDERNDWQSICRMVKYIDGKIWLALLSGNPYNAVKAFEAGASDFLFKPVGSNQIERTISKKLRN